MNKLNNSVIKIVIIASMIFSFALKAEATPPSKIELSYDKKKKLLHVVVKHVTTNMRKHYIRKIDVSKNDAAPEPYYFSKQTSAAELIADIPLVAAPNDVIHVNAVCSDAGQAEESLVITED